jgi:predicted nucleic acid-binding protein
LAKGTFELVASEHILDELREAFEDRYFKKKLTRRQRKGALALLRRLAIITDITATVSGVAAHVEDDLVLATALSAGAAYLVTGDERFQVAVAGYGAVRVLSPIAFLAVLTESGWSDG